MAKRHVLILSDREGLLSQSSAVPADEAGRALDRVFISHPHPKTGAPKKFFILGGRFHEVQRIHPSIPTSWFVGDSVVSDGTALLVTPVHPVFLLLPILYANQGCFSPFSQLFSSHNPVQHANAAAHAASSAGDGEEDDFGSSGSGSGASSSSSSELCTSMQFLAAVPGLHKALASVCIVREDSDGGEPLYRLDEAAAVSHLAARVQRLGAALQAKAGADALAAASAGGFFARSEAAPGFGSSSSGEAGGDASSPSALSGPVSQAHLDAALAIVGEYLAPHWLVRLAMAVGSSAATAAAATSASAASASPPTPAPVSKAAAWNAVALEETSNSTSRFLTIGSRDAVPVDADAPAPKPKTPAAAVPQTMGVRKLAKANLKGVPSLTSFFSKAPSPGSK